MGASPLTTTRREIEIEAKTKAEIKENNLKANKKRKQNEGGLQGAAPLTTTRREIEVEAKTKAKSESRSENESEK